MKVTIERIESLIITEFYVGGRTLGQTTPVIGPGAGEAWPTILQHSCRAIENLTICVLVLANDFTVVGKSACADPAEFREEVGRRLAREDAVRQIWALEGYVLRNQLHLGDSK